MLHLQASSSIYTLRLELYGSNLADRARFTAEVILTGCVLLLLAAQAHALLHALVAAPAGVKLHAARAAVSVLELSSNALMALTCILWWDFKLRHASSFAMQLRYPVYEWDDLQPAAHFLRLGGGGEQLRAAWGTFAALRAAIGVLNWYYALNGINILLMIGRWAPCALGGACCHPLMPSWGALLLSCEGRLHSWEGQWCSCEMGSGALATTLS